MLSAPSSESDKSDLAPFADQNTAGLPQLRDATLLDSVPFAGQGPPVQSVSFDPD